MAPSPRRGRPRRCLRASVAFLGVSLAFLCIARLSPPASAHLPDDEDWFARRREATHTAVAEPPAESAPSPSLTEAVAPAPEPALPPAPAWDGAAPPELSSVSAAVIDADSGAMLFGQDPHRRLPPASITKIVTAMVALEHGNLDDLVTVDIDGPAFAIQTDSSIMGLHVGDQLRLRDLLYGLLLPSGNDAAVAIARSIAGSESAFVDLMNAKVAQLGLQNTHFTNPHGLNNPNHYTSAYDISQLALWAMKDERFRQIVSTPQWTVHGSRTYTVRNLNGLLWYARGADGIKTGWHEQAGMTIVGSVTRNGHRVIVTLLNDQKQLPDSGALIDWTFGHFAWSLG